MNSPDVNESIAVVVDGTRRDVSNLANNKSGGAPTTQAPPPRRTTSRRHSEPSLYPTASDLPTLETTDVIFQRVPRRKPPSKQKLLADKQLSEKWSKAFEEELKIEDDNVEKKGDDDKKDDIMKETIQEEIAESNKEQHNAKKTFDRRMVEVTPGHFVPLCGAAETLQAVEDHATRETNCVSCAVSLLVVNKASMVICPSCEMISPILDGEEDEQLLGLGLRQVDQEDDENTHE